MLDAGSRFAHFVIVRKLGAGGMGQVFLAEDSKLGRQVALKTLSSEYFDKSEQLERFYREARTVAQISHPNVMAIYDLGVSAYEQAGEINYIVMEYVKGKSLTEFLTDGKADLKEILRISERIATGLAAAHKLNIVHRDIKAENIIVDESGEPKILDFGLAKPVAPLQFDDEADTTRTVSKDLTRAGKIVGTVSYMSPEQVRGDTIDTRSDIFSFGVLFYRMVTGNMPFAGPSQVVTLAKILESTPEPLRVKNEEIPYELERIIDKCLQKNPDDRYQDTRDLVVDIRNLRKSYDSGISDSVTGLRTAVHKAPPKPKGSFWANLSWKQVVLLVVAIPFIFLAVIAITAMIFDNNDGPMIQVHVDEPVTGEGLAVLGFDNKTGDTTLNWLQTGLPEILVTDLTQNQSAQVISRDRIQDYMNSHDLEPNHDNYTKAAKALGARTLLSGSFYKMGERIRIDARLEDMSSGRIVMGEKVVGADPFSLVDSLSYKVAASLNIATGEGQSGSIANVTSSSPEAYKAYHGAMESFNDGRYDDAMKGFAQAVKLDSTFALPYMRMGMASVFQGRQTQGAEFMKVAKKYESKLPLKERGLLDAYTDFWLNRKIDDGFSKMKSLVSFYPDDKEIRTVFGLLNQQLNNDTVTAFAEIDSALVRDPDYAFALAQLSGIHERYGNYMRALEYSNRVLEKHPNSKTSYEAIARLSRRLGKIDDAISVYERMARQFPDDPDPLSYLSTMAVRKRDFAKAEMYAEQYRAKVAKDPFNMLDYYQTMQNISIWRGEFRRGLGYSFKNLEDALKLKDSALVCNAYLAIATAYRTIAKTDSALVYSKHSYAWANSFQKAAYPMTLVNVDPANDKIARPLIDKWVQEFKERLPASNWPIADNLMSTYQAMVKSDTAAMIAAIEQLIKVQARGSWDDNEFDLGELLVKFNKPAEGKTYLLTYISGPRESATAMTYLSARYLLGMAEQALGNKQAAIEHFQEMLKYWGKADIEITEIADAKGRLAKLTS